MTLMKIKITMMMTHLAAIVDDDNKGDDDYDDE